MTLTLIKEDKTELAFEVKSPITISMTLHAEEWHSARLSCGQCNLSAELIPPTDPALYTQKANEDGERFAKFAIAHMGHGDAPCNSPSN